MRFLVYLLAGLAGGVLGGMGMGGGCVLIPILTVLCGVPQHMAQSVNLLSFLPMALLSLRVHSQNGLLDTKGVLWVILPAVALSVLGGIFVKGVSGGALKTSFGVFLCVLSVWQFYTGVKGVLAERNARGVK